MHSLLREGLEPGVSAVNHATRVERDTLPVAHRYYGYKMTDDTGFAPCVTESFLSLACCMTSVRKRAQKDSWIAGFGGAALGHGKLIYLMQVERAMTFDEYFKTTELKGRFDNIYFLTNGEYLQVPTARCHKNSADWKHDTSVDRILIARRFVYFGCSKVDVPSRFHDFIPHARTYRCTDGERVDAFVTWAFAKGAGIAGKPHMPLLPSPSALVGIS